MGKEPALPKNIRQIGDMQGRERICLEDYVMTYIRKKEPQEEQGYLGIFLGEQQQSADNVYIFIRGILEVPAEVADGELVTYLHSEGEKYFPGSSIVGSCIIGAYPAARMEKLSALVPESGNLLYHLQEQEESLYWLENGQYRRIRGYFIYYEQNQEMQEYLAEVFRDDRIEKDALPDTAIKNFREKVKEKGIQKQGSLLKLASSFLVITVLVIGAIAVNRVEEIRTIQNLYSDHTMENEVQPAMSDVAEELSLQSAGDTAEASMEYADLAEEGPVEYVMDPILEGSELFWKDSFEDEGKKTGFVESSSEIEQIPESTPEMMSESFSELGSESKMSGETNSEANSETVSEKTSETAVETASRQLQASYVIKTGDTLADICSQYYGSMEKLEEICQLNGISDANMIWPGQKIVLP